MEMNKLLDEYGRYTFNDETMKERIPKSTYKAFHEAVDAQFDRLKVDQRDRRMKSYRNNVSEMAGKGKGKLYSERDRLMRTYERMKNCLLYTSDAADE